MIILVIFLLIYGLGMTARTMYLNAQLELEVKQHASTSLELEKEQTKALAPPKPICQCKHNYSVHGDNGCQERLSKTSDGVATKQTFFCPCAKYVGPEPLPAYYAPDLLEYRKPDYND